MSGASVAVGVCREGRMPNLEPASVFYQLGGFFTRQNEKCFTATTTTRMLRAENGERMMRKREKKEEEEERVLEQRPRTHRPV